MHVSYNTNNKKMNNNKKIIFLIIGVFLVGGFFGSLIAAKSAQANIFQDFYNNLFKMLPEKTNILNGASSTIVQAPSGKYESSVDYEDAVMKAVEKASPAVVSIIVSKNVPIIEQCPGASPFSNLPEEFRQFFGNQGMQFYQPCQKGTKLQEVGGGSGFIISSDGLVITNKHVVLDKDASYTVLTNDGKKYDAKVLAQSPVLDLAVVKIDANNLPGIALADSDGLRLGQTSIAIGNALGEFRNTVSVGVVSGLARTITASGEGLSETIEGVIQSSAAINPGNSGGPLLNLRGEVIGINVATVSGAQNVGFAIPINQAKKAIESVKKSGKITTPFIGVRYMLVNSDLAKKEKLSVDYGALVRGGSDGSGVVKNSPAYKAGIKAEDIILEVGGKKVEDGNSLSSLTQNYNVGDTVILKILRDDKEIEVKVVLEERPAGQ